jgi:hypothetical protein
MPSTAEELLTKSKDGDCGKRDSGNVYFKISAVDI